jgi:glycosyltransferase involved in cell wall biosynthesis
MSAKNRPLISIILPVYNGEKYLRESLQSCVDQTYENIEIVIVNDCSTDDSFIIAQQFAERDERIQIVDNAKNKKLPASLNVGHRRAKGDYITWTSDDNELKEDFIEKLFEGIEKEKVDVVFSNYDIVNAEGELKREHQTGPIEHLLFGNKIGASFLYKKEVFKRLNGYNESLFLLEDYDFWLRASLQFKFYQIPLNLYKYRLHSQSLTVEIQADKGTNSYYREGIVNLFTQLSAKLSWSNVSLNLMINHFNGKNTNALHYLKNRKTIVQDISKFNTMNLDNRLIIEGLQNLVRNSLISSDDTKNLKTLLKVLREEKELLFSERFSKKVTLNYILKCFSFQ